MKLVNAIRNIAVVGSLIILAGTAQAEGLHTPGTVRIGPGAGYMHADFSVRYNTQATSNSFVRFSPDVTMGYVHFSGRDEANVYFSCYIPSSSPLYAQALQVAGTLGNGTHLYVGRPLNSSECNDFVVTVKSEFLN